MSACDATRAGILSDANDFFIAAVLDARQLTIKLLANASYGNMGADTWSLCCKPLHEFCLRTGQHYCRLAAKLIEGEGAAHPTGGGRWPGEELTRVRSLPRWVVDRSVADANRSCKHARTHLWAPTGIG